MAKVAVGEAASGPFRIHVVAEMTGIPEPTLRAWERRYGIPSPERTASGYRLYGIREVEQLRAMRTACDGGMSAAEAARWVRTKSDESTAAAAAAASAAGAPATVFAKSEDGRENIEAGAFANVRRGLIDAVTRLDDADFEARIRQAMFLGSATTVLDFVIAPTLVEIGDSWHSGKLTVAHEHFASQRLSTALRDLLRLNTNAHAHGPQVLLAGFADDHHEIGLLGLGLRLSAWGHRPIFLGARTPPSAVRSVVQAASPKLVALSVTITPEPARARELIDDYANACGELPWLIGGTGASPLASLVTERGGVMAPIDPELLRVLIQRVLDPRDARDPSDDETTTQRKTQAKRRK